MKKVTKAVIPAAGLGTRVLPATKAMPKGMLPLVDKPAIQYLVEEAVRSGITDILIIVSRNQGIIQDHFDRSPELEAKLAVPGKEKMLDGGAFAAENGEGEDAAHDGEGAEHTGQCQLFCRVVFHDECSFSIKISCGSRQTAAPAHEQNRHPRRCQKRKKRSRLIGLLSRRNTASHRNI